MLDAPGDGVVLAVKGIMNIHVPDLGALIGDVTARDDIGLKWAAKYVS